MISTFMWLECSLQSEMKIKNTLFSTICYQNLLKHVRKSKQQNLCFVPCWSTRILKILTTNINLIGIFAIFCFLHFSYTIKGGFRGRGGIFAPPTPPDGFRGRRPPPPLPRDFVAKMFPIC